MKYNLPFFVNQISPKTLKMYFYIQPQKYNKSLKQILLFCFVLHMLLKFSLCFFFVSEFGYRKFHSTNSTFENSQFFDTVKRHCKMHIFYLSHD